MLNLNRSPLNFLDFVTNRFIMKFVNANNMQTIEFCHEQSNYLTALSLGVRWPTDVINLLILTGHAPTC